MPRPIIPQIESLRTTHSRWYLVLFGLLAALLAFMPLAYGAVEAWSELIVVAGAAAMSVCLLLRVAFDRHFHLVRTRVYWPFGLFLMLVVLQLVPLPVSWVSLLSPSTWETKSELLGDLAAAHHRTSISFYPLATARMLRLALAGTALFVVVVNTFRTQRQIARLLMVVLVIGSVEGLIGLLHIATLSKSFYWSLGADLGRVITSGSFVNHSNFSQFMNLSLGAGVALLLIRLHEGSKFDGDRSTRVLRAIHWEDHGWLLAGIVLCGVSVLTSMSRNGTISLLAASTVVGTALYRRGSLNWKGWLLVILPLGVLAGIFLVGFDTVYQRLATLEERQHFDFRWEMTLGTLRAWWEYPVWGTGLGTHEFVFPMFDTAVTMSIAENADNDYAQLLEETGLVGAGLVGALLVGLALLCWRLMFRGRTPLSTAAFGLALGLLAVSIHSATDFGQRLPAVFGLSAVTCGLLVAIAKFENRAAKSAAARRAHAPSGPSGRRTRRGMRPIHWVATCLSLAGLTLVWGWALKSAYATYLGEQWWAVAVGAELRLRQESESAQEQETDQAFVDLLAAAESAHNSDPGNVKYGYWLNFYRWQSLSRVVDQETGQVLLHPEVLPFVDRIADQLAQARTVCPTYGPPYALEGQLRLSVLKQETGADLIRKGYSLAPYDPPTCLVAGKLVASGGQLDEARQILDRAVWLNPAYFGEVAELYLFDLDRPDWAQALAAQDNSRLYVRLSQLATLCSRDERYEQLANKLRAAAEAELRRLAATEQSTAAGLATLARIDFDRGDFESAMALFRRSLVMDYSRVDRRLMLAKALIEMGRNDEAMHEARICLRLKPGLKEARDLIGRLGSVSR